MFVSTGLGLYYALDKRLALVEQQLAFNVTTYKEKEIEAKFELAELKETDKQFNRRITKINEQLLKISAVIPNRWYGKTEEENED